MASTTILSDNGASSGSAGIKTTGGNDGVLILQTTTAGGAATTAVTIDTSQNVGIGTGLPAVKLDIVGAGNPTLTLRGSDAAYTGIFNIQGAGGGSSIINAVGGNNALLLQTNSTERARIDASGNLLVGVAAWADGGGGSFISNHASSGINGKFSCSSTSNQVIFYFTNPNGVVGLIQASGSTTSYVTSSDYRLKENVLPMQGALEKVSQLKPCTYTWKADGSNGQGFIAHELAEVCPDAVAGEKDDVNEDGSIKPQGIDTSFLVATLTAAIQEQQALITTLTERITALEAK